MIQLDGVQETMLIPLAIKASETKRNGARIHDPKAVEIIEKLGMDTAKFDQFMSHEGVVARTILFDKAVCSYIKKYPDAQCISIGCGFDDRFSRVDNGRILWYNLDLPEVIRARENYFICKDREKLIGKSALDPQWTEGINAERKTIFVVEGLLMYLQEAEVKTFLQIIKNHFKHAILIVELMSPYATKGSKYHDTVKYTNATFRWGVKTGKEVETYCKGLHFIGEKSFNLEMKKYSIRGKLFATLPFIKHLNNRIAIYSLHSL